MKNIKSILLTILLSFIFVTGLYAKPTQIAKDAKKALKSYAGLSTLKKRGFNLKDLDSADSLEDVYNTLLPYMIKDGVPLDNVISFYDKENYKTYDFRQHYTVHFTDDYGTKEELLAKGYQEDQIFAYFSKGIDVYRGGKFVWEKAKPNINFGEWLTPHLPPVVAEKFIYFWPAYYTEKFYPDYWQVSSTKDYIILDMRFDNGSDYPFSAFFDYLEKVDYKGLVIIISDSTTTASEWLLTFRMTTWVNGEEVPRKFNYCSIGENTLGTQGFANWKNYENKQNGFYNVRKTINQYKRCEEGIGVMPDIWAQTPQDIFKTVEVISGINDFSQQIADYQTYINNLLYQRQYDFSYNPFPEKFCTTEQAGAIKERLSKYNKHATEFLDFISENPAVRVNFQGYLTYQFRDKTKELPEKQYFEFLELFNKYLKEIVVLRENNIGYFNFPDSILKIKDPDTFLQYYSDYIKIQNNWYEFCIQNLDKRSAFNTSEFRRLYTAAEELSPEQFLVKFDNLIDDAITKSIKKMNDLKGDDYMDMLASKLEFKADVKEQNRRLESVFLIFNKYDILQNEGFDVHKMDYMATPQEILNYLQPFFLSTEGYPRDLHTGFYVNTKDGQYYSIKQTSRYIVFNDEYGTKEQLKKKGYVEDVTMFYYPYHDGKFWTKEKNWRTGRMIMAMPNYQSYQQTDYDQIYYTTEKSVYFKFKHFPHPVKNGEVVGPEIEDEQLEEMIVRLSKETGKENVIFDVSKNTGGDSYTSNRISEAVKKSGIKNVYIIIDKGAFSCGDHFPLEAKDYLFKDQNVTLIGYPTMGGTGSGDQETYIINFPDFDFTADIATSFTPSETEHEGWGATPDVYADDLTDALGAVRTLAGDNDIKPFESEQRKEFNKGKKRWLEDDIIFEIK